MVNNNNTHSLWLWKKLGEREMDHKSILLLINIMCMSRRVDSLLFNVFLWMNAQYDGEPSSSMANKRDLEALLSFKRGIISDPQGWLSNWTAHNTHNVCRWNGISCTPSTKRVVAISLSSCGLNGTLSPSIGNLSLLRTLDLSGNHFSGRIPPEVGQLKALGILHLSNNALDGSIPKELCNCTRLQTLDIGYNDLRGPIPPELGLLVQLDTLWLGGINLNGSIPTVLGNCTSLTELDISHLSPWSIIEVMCLSLLTTLNEWICRDKKFYIRCFVWVFWKGYLNIEFMSFV